MYITINKPFVLWGYVHFLSLHTFYCASSVSVEVLLATLAVCSECGSRAAGTLEVVQFKYWFIEEIKPLVLREDKDRHISVIQCCLCRSGQREPLFPQRHPTSPANSLGQRAKWMVGGLLLHTHCFPVATHVLWRKPGCCGRPPHPAGLGLQGGPSCDPYFWVL